MDDSRTPLHFGNASVTNFGYGSSTKGRSLPSNGHGKKAEMPKFHCEKVLQRETERDSTTTLSPLLFRRPSALAGIGSRTAFHLARMGAKVIMACRSVERGEAARAKLQQELAATVGSGKTPSAVRAGTLEVRTL